jgi:hypothetical protein
MDTEHPALCAYCKSEIKPGEPRWTGLEPAEYWHYNCAETVGVTTMSRERPKVHVTPKREDA